MVRLSLLPCSEAKVTPRGIHFHGCFYSCAEAVAGPWFDRARQRGTWKVRISYDTRSLDTIWLHGEGARPAFTPCVLTQASEMWRDRALWEIDQIRQSERRAAARAAPAGHEAKAARNARVRRIADAAAEATAAVRPLRDQGRAPSRKPQRGARGPSQGARGRSGPQDGRFR